MAKKVLLDVDVGCDDATAISMAIGSPAIELVGITTVQGNTTLENTTRNALSVLELLDRPDIPVAKGADRPLTREPITAEHVHGRGGIRGDMPDPAGEVIESHAVDFIIEQVKRHGNDLTIGAFGPQTNLALALARYPSLPNEVDEIWVMGGAAILSRSLGGGFNFKNDPEAASRVFQSASPIMVGIDVTYFAPISFGTVEALESRGRPFDRIADWMSYPAEILAQSSNVTREPVTGPVVHDAVVMAAMIENFLTIEPYYVEVTTGESSTAGRVVTDYHGSTGNEPNASVALEVDAERYEAVFLESIDAFS